MPAVGEERAVGGHPERRPGPPHPVDAVGAQRVRRHEHVAAEHALGHHHDLARARVHEQRLGVLRAARVGELVRGRLDLPVAAAHRHRHELHRAALDEVVAQVADQHLPRTPRRHRLDVDRVAPRGGADGVAAGVDGEHPAGVAGVVHRDEPAAPHHQAAGLDDVGVGERDRHLALGLGPAGHDEHRADRERHGDRQPRQHAHPRHRASSSASRGLTDHVPTSSS